MILHINNQNIEKDQITYSLLVNHSLEIDLLLLKIRDFHRQMFQVLFKEIKSMNKSRDSIENSNSKTSNESPMNKRRIIINKPKEEQKSSDWIF